MFMPSTSTHDWPVETIALGASAAGSVLWRLNGKLRLTVVVKATFSFAPGGVMPLAPPSPLVRGELHHGDSPARSVRACSDLSPHKNRTDVVFVGHACAEGGAAVQRSATRLGLSRGGHVLLDKVLQFYGDRSAAPGQAPSDPKPFQRMPITYERAFGGPGFADNPLGTGANAAGAGAVSLPNIVYPDPARAAVPAGYGPLSMYAAPRKRLLRATPMKVVDRAVPELPEDFDIEFFQSAPEDQRIPYYLQGDEVLLLQGLHAQHTSLQTALPQVRAAARIFQAGSPSPAPLALNADLLFIDGDNERCSVTFRGSVPVADERAASMMRAVAGVEWAGRAIAWPSADTAPVGAPLRLDGPPPSQREATMVLDDANPLEGTFQMTPAQVLAAKSAVAVPFAAGKNAPPAPPSSQRGIPGAPWAPESRPLPKPFTMGGPEGGPPKPPRVAVADGRPHLEPPPSAPGSFEGTMVVGATGPDLAFNNPPNNPPEEATRALPLSAITASLPSAIPFAKPSQPAPEPPSREAVPGAPWAAARAVPAPAPKASFEGTMALDAADVEELVKPIEVKPAPQPALDEIKPIEVKPAPQPALDEIKPIEAPPAKDEKPSEGPSWSWADTAPREVSQPAAPPPPPPPKKAASKTAVGNTLYGKFGKGR